MSKLLRVLTALREADRVGGGIARRIRRFDGWLDRASERDADAADYDHTETVKEYYDISNELMVWGWGESLHFAPLTPGESVADSKIRHQRLMIDKLELREGMTVVDIGCGVGGPMRRVVSEAGVRVVGVNINETQMDRTKSLNTEAGLDHMVDYLLCSFMDMSAVADGTFDRAYAIESTCHAPDKAGAFAEIYRVLKPGALFWGQEMCLTDRFDPGDERHLAMKQDLMHGIALKDIATTVEVDRMLESVGFELIEGMNRGAAEHGSITPWYQPLETWSRTLGNSLQGVPLGRKTAVGGSRLAELLWILPKGTADVVKMLDQTASAYTAGGRSGIFTPLYCFLARKPPEVPDKAPIVGAGS